MSASIKLMSFKVCLLSIEASNKRYKHWTEEDELSGSIHWSCDIGVVNFSNIAIVNFSNRFPVNGLILTSPQTGASTASFYCPRFGAFTEAVKTTASTQKNVYRLQINIIFTPPSPSHSLLIVRGGWYVYRNQATAYWYSGESFDNLAYLQIALASVEFVAVESKQNVNCRRVSGLPRQGW